MDEASQVFHQDSRSPGFRMKEVSPHQFPVTQFARSVQDGIVQSPQDVCFSGAAGAKNASTGAKFASTGAQGA